MMRYFRSWRYEYIIGFDGAGAFDYRERPFTPNVSERLRDVGSHVATPGLPETGEQIVLRARNGVRPFGFAAAFPLRFAVFDCTLMPLLEAVAVSPRPVVVQFSDRKLEMCAANFDIPDIREFIFFSASRFDLFDNASQMIDYNKISIGELSSQYPSKPLASNLTFENIDELTARSREESMRLRSIQPSEVGVRLDLLPSLISFGAQVLFREDLTKAISILDSPGTFFPAPAIDVSIISKGPSS